MLLRYLWPRVRRFVPISLYPLLAIPYRWDVKRTIKRLERQDADFFAKNPGVVAPPAKLRFKVVRTCTVEEFLADGVKSVDFLEAGLQVSGTSFAQASSALDFGCGCARSILALLKKYPHVKVTGADVDAEAIQWCQANIKGASFDATPALPPLPYKDASFDVVYTISVFTHLDEERQFKWLADLKRVVRPGGVLLATVHGTETWKDLPAAAVERIKKDGIVFANTAADKGVHPDWYQTTWHTEKYIRDKWSQYFDVRGYIVNGMVFDLDNGLKVYQDMVVLQRRQAD